MPLIQTPRQRERRMRNEIASAIAEFERQHELEWGTINRRAMRVFGKGRQDMTERELQEVWAWVQTLTVESLL